MNRQGMTGLQLFLRYAFPCATEKLKSRSITPKDLEKLKWHIIDQTDPDPTFLEYCFPAAVRNYRRHCLGKNWEADFSLASVRDYWMHNHGHSGDCAVEMAEVTGIKERKIETNLGKPVINIYRIELYIGALIAIHRRAVIEIVPRATVR